jgi:predicted Zn-dependent peptidase
MYTVEYEKFILENGLSVILHEDKTLPLTAVNVWYHVGSKNEEIGKTGFAHLFEHMMFEGSKNHRQMVLQHQIELIIGRIYLQIVWS